MTSCTSCRQILLRIVRSEADSKEKEKFWQSSVISTRRIGDTFLSEIMFIPVSLGYMIAAKPARARIIEHAIDRPKTVINFFSSRVHASTGSGEGAPEPAAGRR
jgi:hypothetical protein